MPSGPKKRKAARRKKEQGPNLDSPTTSQGNGGEKVGDQMSHSSKESDNGDTDSPTSQECSTQLYLVNEKRDSSQSGIEKPMEGSGNGDLESQGDRFSTKTDKEVVVDRELKGEESSSVVDINIDGVRSEKGSQEDSSDEDDISDDELKGKELENSISGSPIETVEQSASFSKEVTEGIENSSSDLRIKPVEQSASLFEEASRGIEKSSSSPLIEPVGQSTFISKELTQSIENSSSSTRIKSLEQSSCLSEEVSQVIDNPVEKPGSPDDVDDPPKVNEENLSSSLETHTEKSIDESEYRRVSDNLRNSENEPQIALTLERPSSWKSCCGIFDVLMGSHR